MHPPHGEMASEVKETWGSSVADGFDVVYYWGARAYGTVPPLGEAVIEGRDLLLGVEGSVYSILAKTLMAYRHLINKKDFDYIFRCCTGCYVIPSMLVDFAYGKTRDRLWCGVTDWKSFPYPFVSGAGMLLSRDVVGLIVENEERLLSSPHPGFMDDVSIGWLMHSLGIKPDPSAPRADNTDVPVDGCHHYHFGPSPSTMRALHAKLSR